MKSCLETVFSHFLLFTFLILLLIFQVQVLDDKGFNIRHFVGFNFSSSLTFFLAELFELFATFAFVLAAELHDANGEEDCQNPKADENAHRRRVHRAPCERTRCNWSHQLKRSIQITRTALEEAILHGVLLPIRTTNLACSSIRLPDLNWINRSVRRSEDLALMKTDEEINARTMQPPRALEDARILNRLSATVFAFSLRLIFFFSYRLAVSLCLKTFKLLARITQKSCILQAQSAKLL